MSEPFIPFVPVSTAAAADQAAAPAFRVVTDQSAGLAAAPAPGPVVSAAGAAAAAPCHSSPQVTLQRDGDRVTHITVRCSCGQVIELACE